MKIAPTYGGKGLNDDGEECDIIQMYPQSLLHLGAGKPISLD